MTGDIPGWHKLLGQSVYIDTNIFIYAAETGHRSSETLREIFRAIDETAILAFTSESTLAEVLAKPLMLGAADLVDIYEEILRPDGALTVVPIERSVLRTAAKLQGELGMKLADAIHIATARRESCDVFLTNDDRLRPKIKNVIHCTALDELAGQSPDR